LSAEIKNGKKVAKKGSERGRNERGRLIGYIVYQIRQVEIVAKAGEKGDSGHARTPLQSLQLDAAQKNRDGDLEKKKRVQERVDRHLNSKTRLTKWGRAGGYFKKGRLK